MKKHIVVICALMIPTMISSCASIVSQSRYLISINSSPSDATIVITNSVGTEVYQGVTPATVSLNSSEGFFKKASYQVKFVKDGYNEKIVPIYFKLDGWYWGNILFGGLLGMLIIDPATGAMYKLDSEFINEKLTQLPTASNVELRIYNTDEIPSSWSDHLILLSE